MIWTAFSALSIIGMLAFAVDLGRITVAKSELQTAADAAARYAAQLIEDSEVNVTTAAQAAAAENRADGRVVSLSSVTRGRYDSTQRTFTPNATPFNAVRVVAQRSGSDGVPLIFARLFGISHQSITARGFAVAGSASATLPSVAGPVGGFVGVDWFNINGPLNVRAWDSASNTHPNASTAWARGQTRGPANLNSGVILQGELQTSGSVSMNSATITRGITTLPSGALNFITPTVPSSGVTNLGNYNGPSGASQTFPAGKYRFDTFQVPAGKTVTFSGPVEIYMTGSWNINGAIQTFDNKPSNLKIFGASDAGVDIGSHGSPIYAEVFAPASPFNLNNRTFYGSLIAKGINVTSSFNMHIDARTSYGGFNTPTTSSAGGIMTVLPITP
jgi:Flp pilus assembly protein TadG